MNPVSPAKASAPKSDSAGRTSTLGRALFQQRIESVLLHSKQATGADGVAVSMKEGEQFICRASVGCAPEIGVGVIAGQGVCGRCIQENAPVVEGALAGDIKSVAAVPIRKNGQVFGLVAGFSLDPRAFSTDAVEEFQKLSDRIQSELEPSAVELSPEDDGDRVFAKLGLDFSGSQPQAELPVEEDDAYLTDLVRQVLEATPTQSPAPQVQVPSAEDAPPVNGTPRPGGDLLEADATLRELLDDSAPESQAHATPSPLIEAQDVLPEPAPPKAGSEELLTPNVSPSEVIPSAPPDGKEGPPPSFSASATSAMAAAPAPAPIAAKKPRMRTTEDVLMEVVATPFPATRKPKRPETTHLEPAAEKRTLKEQPARLAEPERAETIASVLAEPEAPAPDDWLSKLPSRRILVISAAALLALGAASAGFFYLRTSPTKTAPQQTQAPAQQPPAVSAQQPPQTVAESTVQPPKPTVSETKRSQPVRQASEPPAPIVVESSGGPTRRVTDDAAPVELSSVGAKESAPLLPTRQTAVTFGGRQSSGTIPPRLIHRFDPIFPALARSMHITGDVQMDALVGPDGRIVSVSNVKGHNVLANAAIDAVKKWRYEPARQDGKNVESVVQVTVRFR